jgi:gamma-glutamyl hercynylcysteine S-oxide synthase
MYSVQGSRAPESTVSGARQSPPPAPVSAAALAGELCAARERVRAVLAGIDAAHWLGPRLSIVNPPLWELGHLGWFQERWLLRRRGDGALAPSLLAGADALYDSARVAHGTRWDLPLPSPAATWRYLDQVLEQALERLHRQPTELGYYAWLCAGHEQMHAEALRYTWQTHGYAAPAEAVGEAYADAPVAGGVTGDIEFAGGRFELGASPAASFVFDNEKWAHPVALAPFAIARCATSMAQYAAFVDDGGYRDARWWSAPGWAWREQAAAGHPLYWRAAGRRQGWEVRDHQDWLPLRPELPMLHVNAWEAQAWCRWAGRRLPSEAEWEYAASHAGATAGSKRSFAWGEAAPSPQRANLWWPDLPRASRPLPGAALGAGDSAAGCRQLIGNVWEWTSSVFAAYPGFVIDPYAEYSAPAVASPPRRR